MTRACALLVVLAAVPKAPADCVGWAGFRPPARYASSADQEIRIRDLDGDGAPEVILSGNQVDELGAFSILPNRGDGTFAAEELVPSAFGETLQDVADLNRDSIPDLLVSNYWSNGIDVYFGKGRLRFESGVPYATATHGGPSLIADVDRDGVPDVVSLSFGSGNPVRVHVFHGRADGTLSPKTTFDTELANGASASARMIGGALEILVNERSGHLGILHYTDGSLSVSKLSAGPGLDLGSTFADVNGDGIADIVDTQDPGIDVRESIYVTLANSDGTFRERVQLAQPRKVAFPVEVRVRDIDGDGHADLIVADFRATNLYSFRGTGRGDFAAGVPIDAGGPVNSFAIADVDGDGRPDIVTANDDHSASVLLNAGPCSPRRRSVTRR
jgi:VCBS repeat protein